MQNPRLGDSMLLRGEGQLREEEGCPQRPVRHACLTPGRNLRLCRRMRTPNQPLGAGRLTHLRPILGVKGGVGFSRDLWRKSALSTRCPERAPLPPHPAKLPKPCPPGGEAGGRGGG